MTIPANSFVCLTANAIYSMSPAQWIAIAKADGAYLVNANVGTYNASCTLCERITAQTTYFVWARFEGVSNNPINITGFYIKAKI